MQHGGEREGGEQVAHRPDGAGQRDQHRIAPGAEPRGDIPKHADEGHRVAAAEQHAREQGDRVGRSEREGQLAQRHQPGSRGEHPARAVAIDKHAGRDLHRGIDADLEEHEDTELRVGDPETLFGKQPGDAERAAVEDRQEVHGDGEHPAADVGAGCGVAQRGRCGEGGHQEISLGLGVGG